MTAAELAKRLGFKRSGNQWLGCCVAHPDRNPSMIIFDGRNGSAQVRCLAGCASSDIIGVLRERGVWAGNGNGHAEPDDDADRIERDRAIAAKREANRLLAIRIARQGVDPSTLPVGYLGGRGLALPIEVAMSVARYHPRCPRGEGSAPALVVLMRNIDTFQEQAIQRIFLEEDPITGIVRKLESKMLGSAGGAAMMLSSPEETFGEELAWCPKLNVCEGFETGLALYLAGVRPIWALGSAGAIAGFAVHDRIGHLVICADNDENEVGLKAAVECCDRWNEAEHRSAEIKMPPNVGDDWCDHLTGVRHD